MAATAASLSSIFASASSFSLTHLPFDKSHACLSKSLSPMKKPLKTLILISPNLTLSPISPLCYSSAEFNDTGDSISDEFEEISDEEEQEGEDFLEEDEIEEIKGYDSADNCRIYVGNLPYSMTSNELSETFSEAGQVRSVEIVYDKLTDRSRGFGFVTMGSLDEAKEAVRTFDGSQIGGRTVKVNFPEVPRGGERKVMGPRIRISNQSFVDTPHKIYVGNLGWGVTTQGLRDAFADQPGFLSAKVIYERETGRSRGFGFVTFSSADSAQSSLTSMNGVELEGRPLRLNMAADKARSTIGQSELLSTVS